MDVPQFLTEFDNFDMTFFGKALSDQQSGPHKDLMHSAYAKGEVGLMMELDSVEVAHVAFRIITLFSATVSCF